MSLSTHDSLEKAPFPWSFFWTGIGMLLLFLCAVILLVKWNPEPPTDDALRAQERIKNLAQLRQENQKLLSSYGWVDEAQGVAHIPIEEAMKLELPSLNAPEWQPQPAYPIADIDLTPHPAGVPTPTPTPTETTAPPTADQ